jgi:hypothetical protein
VVARSTLRFAGDVQVVALGGGRILVTDPRNLLVLALDSALSKATVVADSIVGAPAPRGYILPFRGDSGLVVSNAPAPGVMLVVGPDGRIARTMATPPRTGFRSSIEGLGTTSSALGLLWREKGYLANGRLSGSSRPRATDPNAATATQWAEEVEVVLRMAYDTRAIDTVLVFGSSNRWQVTDPALAGTFSATYPLWPFPFYNEVVTTSDGAVALFHAQQFRIDWKTPDGRPLPATQLTYPWRKISDDLRARILDSANTGRRRAYDSVVAKRAADSARTGSPPMILQTQIGSDSGAVPVQRMVPAPPPRAPQYLHERAIPSYYPPTTGRRQVLADADNNVWIRIAALTTPDASVWEIVNREKGVVDRVRIPTNLTVAGFGPGGFVYLLARDAGSVTIERVRVK